MIDNARIKYNARKSPSSDRLRPRPNVLVCEGLPQQRRLWIKKRAKDRKPPSSDRPRPRPNVPVCEGLPQQRRLRIKKRANTQYLHVRFMTANIGSMTGKSREIADIMHRRKKKKKKKKKNAFIRSCHLDPDGLTNRLPDSTIPVISFVPYQKSKRFFHIFILYLNSPNHALHSCVLLGVLLMGKSYCRGIFKT